MKRLNRIKIFFGDILWRKIMKAERLLHSENFSEHLKKQNADIISHFAHPTT